MKKDYNDIDIFVLKSTQPFCNLILSAPFTPTDLAASMRKLEADGLITLKSYGFFKFKKGPATITDLEKLIAAAGPLRPAFIVADSSGWQHGESHAVFGEDSSKTIGPFWNTRVALTLRGHAFLHFRKPDYDLQAIAAHNSQQTPSPRNQKTINPGLN